MKKDKTKIEGSRNDKPSLEDLARQAAVDDRDLIHKIVGVPKPKLKPTPRSKQDIDSDINAQPTPISTILTESGRRKHIPVVYLSDVDLDELYEQAGDGGVFANPDFYSKVDTEERIVFHTEPDSTDRCFLFCSSNAVKQPIAILKAPSSSMAWVPDKGLFISCDNNYIYNWNPSSGKVKIFEHELIQPSLEYAPDLGLLVSSEGTVIRYIDPQGNLDKKEITSTKLDIHSMKWVPHLGLFVLANEGFYKITESDLAPKIYTYSKSGLGPDSRMAWVPDYGLVYSCNSSSSGKLIFRVDKSGTIRNKVFKEMQNNCISSLKYVPNKGLLVGVEQGIVLIQVPESVPSYLENNLSGWVSAIEGVPKSDLQSMLTK